MEGANTIRLREKATDDDAVLKYPAFMKKNATLSQEVVSCREFSSFHIIYPLPWQPEVDSKHQDQCFQWRGNK